MKKGFKDDNPAMAFISQRDAEPGNFAPLGNSSDGVGQGSKPEGTDSRSEFLRPASGWLPPGGEKTGGTVVSPMRRAPGVTPGLDNFAPLGNSPDGVGQGTKSEGIHPTGGEKMGGASRSPTPGGENKNKIEEVVSPMRRAPGVTPGLDNYAPLGNSSDGVGQGTKSEGIHPTGGEKIAGTAVPPGGEKIAGTAVPPLGNSPDGVGQGSESEGIGSRSDTLAPSLRLAGTAVPPRWKMDPRYIETKSKRFGILLQPSVLETLKELAGEKGISVNEAINEAIKQYIQREEGNISSGGDQW